MEFIEILKVLLLGLVEGVTEWLPISSTGHMIILNEFIKLDVTPDFMKMFEVVIQLGAIFAVIVVFWKKLWPFTTDKKHHYVKKDIWVLWLKILVACIPFGVMGVLFNDVIDSALNNYVIVAIMLIVYGILFIIIEKSKMVKGAKISEISQLSYKTAFFIGAIQVLAMIPGTSRSGVSIIGAILLGTSRLVATEFSFYLAVPAMVGASAVSIMDYGLDFTKTEIAILLLGMLTAFVVSIIVIRFLMNYLKKHNFVSFGWYRIVLGIIVLAYFAVFGT